MGKENFTDFADVVVIGGGVVGAAIARELSKYDIKIVLIEKEPDIALGVSRKNMGIIHPLIPHFGTLKEKLCYEGNKYFDALSKELDFRFRRVDLLIVAFSRIQSILLKVVKYILRKRGLDVKSVSRDELMKMEPNISKSIRSALLVPNGGVVYSEEFVVALMENAVENGVKVYLETKVLDFVVENNRVVGVVTDKGIIKTKIVINASGLGADELVSKIGLDSIRFEPSIGVMVVLDPGVKNFTNHIIAELPFRIDPRTKGGGAGIDIFGRLVWGPNLRKVKTKFDEVIVEEDIRVLLKKFGKIFPQLNEDNIIYFYGGIRPALENGDFVIGETKVDGFINVIGIQSPGLTAAPAIAKIVESIVVRKLKPRIKKNFKRTRKRIKRILDMDERELKDILNRDKSYGKIVCLCEMISEGEILEAIRRGARTVESILVRLGVPKERCRECRCIVKIAEILAKELGKDIEDVYFVGLGSKLR